MNSANDNNFGKELGEKFRQAREKAGLTQAEVAERAGVNVNYYARIERGEVNTSVKKLQSINKVLRIKSLGLF